MTITRRLLLLGATLVAALEIAVWIAATGCEADLNHYDPEEALRTYRLIESELRAELRIGLGRAITNAPCNGWEHWHYLDESTGERVAIDELRELIWAGQQK